VTSSHGVSQHQPHNYKRFPSLSLKEGGPLTFSLIPATKPIWVTRSHKGTFERFEELVSNENLKYGELTIKSRFSSGVEIPENTINKLEFQKIIIESQKRISYVHPNAFPGTYGTTTYLSIISHDYQGQPDIFEFFDNFIALNSLMFTGYGGLLPHIPERAFKKAVRIQEIGFYGTHVQSIGEYAFAALKNLKDLELANNNLSLNGVASKAFEDMGIGVRLTVYDNPGIDHLPEEKFKGFLDTADSRLHVGSSVNMVGWSLWIVS